MALVVGYILLWYPSDILKRAIRRKAVMCVVRDGVMYVQKKEKK